MTHDETTAALRGYDWPIFDTDDHHEIADRLDRYRDALIESKRKMDKMAHALWGSPGSGEGWLGTKFIDEALK